MKRSEETRKKEKGKRERRKNGEEKGKMSILFYAYSRVSFVMCSSHFYGIAS